MRASRSGRRAAVGLGLRGLEQRERGAEARGGAQVGGGGEPLAGGVARHARPPRRRRRACSRAASASSHRPCSSSAPARLRSTSPSGHVLAPRRCPSAASRHAGTAPPRSPASSAQPPEPLERVEPRGLLGALRPQLERPTDRPRPVAVGMHGAGRLGRGEERAPCAVGLAAARPVLGDRRRGRTLCLERLGDRAVQGRRAAPNRSRRRTPRGRGRGETRAVRRASSVTMPAARGLLGPFGQRGDRGRELEDRSSAPRRPPRSARPGRRRRGRRRASRTASRTCSGNGSSLAGAELEAAGPRAQAILRDAGRRRAPRRRTAARRCGRPRRQRATARRRRPRPTAATRRCRAAPSGSTVSSCSRPCRRSSLRKRRSGWPRETTRRCGRRRGLAAPASRAPARGRRACRASPRRPTAGRRGRRLPALPPRTPQTTTVAQRCAVGARRACEIGQRGGQRPVRRGAALQPRALKDGEPGLLEHAAREDRLADASLARREHERAAALPGPRDRRRQLRALLPATDQRGGQ